MAGGDRPAHWALRERLSPGARRRLRRAVDPLLAPVGSLSSVRGAGRRIALTFDDGPDPAHTAGVLDALAERRVKATFFMLGERAEAEPELARRVVAEGHEVALHGTDHARLTRLSAAEVDERVRGGRRRLEAVVGRPVRLFRPPYGAQSLRTWLAVRRAGMRVVVWTVDPRDWAADETPAGIAAAAGRLTTPGAIVLLHDGVGADAGVATGASGPYPTFDRAESTSAVLETLAVGGWLPGTVGDLLATGHPVNSAWFRP
jgi:peptidoglycan/xylan/chitin deacetylase (PgdA/CDA1 family)